VLLTYGASLSNPLASVAGSSSSSSPLGGVYPALALVGWYNGHPAFSHLSPDLSRVKRVSVIGHGNVALDVSRILLKDVAQLAQTDIPDEVLHVLSQSGVESVTATGRRGPGQVAFTTKEFREMLNLPAVSFEGLNGELVEQARGMVEGDRMKKRLLGLMEKSSATSAGGAKKQFKLDFLKSPKAFHGEGEGGRVGGVEWTINELLTSSPSTTPSPPASQVDSIPRASVVARPTAQTVSSPAEMVVESVGYRSEPLGIGEKWTLPFDFKRGRVQNVGGRIVDETGSAVSPQCIIRCASH
jgi:adrenodoxin-NADP+ reductase